MIRPRSLGIALMVPLLALMALGCTPDRRGGHVEPDERLTPAPTWPPRAVLSMTGVDWVLVNIAGQPAVPTDSIAGRPRFRLDPSDQRRVSGFTGINPLGGTYEQSGGALQFGPLRTTRRAGSPPLMRQEAQFLESLQRTTTADLHDNRLRLRDAAGNTLAEFEAGDVASEPTVP